VHQVNFLFEASATFSGAACTQVCAGRIPFHLSACGKKPTAGELSGGGGGGGGERKKSCEHITAHYPVPPVLRCQQHSSHPLDERDHENHFTHWNSDQSTCG